MTVAPPSTGRVLAIAVRTERKGLMREVDQALAHPDGGLDGDLATHPDRGITLLDAARWKQVTAELGADLPWHTRRANVLVEGLSLRDLLGKTVRLGEIELEIKGETKPCGLMDELHAGLRETLEADWRGGVHGRVRSGGTVRIGDPVRVC